MRKFKVGIDSYSLKPLDLDPFELLDWATINEAEGVQFSETPAKIGVAPALGAHNDEVLARLGYSEQQIGDFRARKVI